MLIKCALLAAMLAIAAQGLGTDLVEKNELKTLHKRIAAFVSDASEGNELATSSQISELNSAKSLFDFDKQLVKIFWEEKITEHRITALKMLIYHPWRKAAVFEIILDIFETYEIEIGSDTFDILLQTLASHPYHSALTEDKNFAELATEHLAESIQYLDERNVAKYLILLRQSEFSVKLDKLRKEFASFQYSNEYAEARLEVLKTYLWFIDQGTAEESEIEAIRHAISDSSFAKRTELLKAMTSRAHGQKFGWSLTKLAISLEADDVVNAARQGLFQVRGGFVYDELNLEEDHPWDKPLQQFFKNTAAGTLALAEKKVRQCRKLLQP